jgi:hypothetical protein
MDNIPIENKCKPVEKPKKRKCAICKKKLGILDFGCRCENLYCFIHRLPEQHNCSFDYEKMGKDILEKKNPQIVADKIIKI